MNITNGSRKAPFSIPALRLFMYPLSAENSHITGGFSAPALHCSFTIYTSVHSKRV